MLTDAVRVSLLGSVEQQYANVDLAVTAGGQLADLGDAGAAVSPLGADSLALVRGVPGVWSLAVTVSVYDEATSTFSGWPRVITPVESMAKVEAPVPDSA